jgi:RNase H-fold protein (predicted Holliday junction resolvase)
MRILNLKTFVEELRPFRRRAETAVTHHILALDVGTKKIGLAKCDLHHFQTIPCGYIERKLGVDASDAIAKLSKSLQHVIDKEVIVGIVAGFPLTPDNALTPLAKKILKDMSHLDCYYQQEQNLTSATQSIGDRVAQSIGPQQMICTFWDERDTTSNARAIIRTQYSSKLGVLKRIRDPLSAVLILEDFKSNVLGKY